MNLASKFKWTKQHLITVLTSGKRPIVTDPLLINALHIIDRADFVPEMHKSAAYEDTEIPIGYNETLTKPTTLISMISYLEPKNGGVYLDIGSGTGYTAALIACVAGETGQVYSMERLHGLWVNANENFKKYKKYGNVEFTYRDGKDGLMSKAPYDGIHIAYSVDHIPEVITDQLKVGGKLVVPKGDMNLRIITKTEDGLVEEQREGFILKFKEEGLG